MLIQLVFFGSQNGLIVYESEEKKSVAAIVFGRDAAAEIFRIADIPNTQGNSLDLERLLRQLPPISVRPKILVETSCVRVIEELTKTATDHWDFLMKRIEIPWGTAFALFGQKAKLVDDAVIGFRHPTTGEFHFHICFSKEQGRTILDELYWLPERICRTNRSWLEESKLPERSDRVPVDIDSDLGTILVAAFVFKNFIAPAN
jgi:hypothetical protein